MFNDGKGRVKGELLWTLLSAASLRLECRNPGQNRRTASLKEATDAPRALRVSSFLR